jgi:hypothetical protein
MNTKDEELRQLIKPLLNIIALICEHQAQLFKLITIISPPLSESKKKEIQALQQSLVDAVILLQQQSKNLPPS